MSTGADAKTMPVTAEYEEGHARAFGEHRPQGVPRAVYVMRCSECDGVQHAADTRLYVCPQCRKWTYGSLLLDEAPALPAQAINAPIMAGRFYENTASPIDGSDIGSRSKYQNHLKQHGVTHYSDYKEKWANDAARREQVKQGKAPSKTRREALERAMYKLDKP